MLLVEDDGILSESFLDIFHQRLDQLGEAPHGGLERVRIEFLEWTEADRLRHSKFAGLREDKEPRDVSKEHGGEG
jgi:hypothetical protein